MNKFLIAKKRINRKIDTFPVTIVLGPFGV